MSFYMIGESMKDFDNWMNAQMQPSIAPTNPQTQRGQPGVPHPFLRDVPYDPRTTAGSRVGPDLTHLASRSSIAVECYQIQLATSVAGS